jgi:hypothetical protein
MFKKILNKIFVVFIGTIAGSITGFVTTTIVGFAIIVVLADIYPSPSYQATFSELLGNSVILFGTYGTIGGFITGVGVTLMGIRPYAKLIWPLIVSIGIVLGGLIGKGDRGVQSILHGNWYPPLYITIIIAIAAWPIVSLIERMLSNRLTRGRITPWIMSGYFVAIVFIAFITYRLLIFFTAYLFH